MTTEPIFVDETASLETVLRLMIENGVRRIPVVSRTDKNPRKGIGIITLDDLIVAKAVSVNELHDIVRAQVKTARVVPKETHREFVSEDRAEARAAQTIGRFHHVVAQATGLTQNETQKAVWIILANLIRRLTPGAAANFAAQLPKQLQDELLGLPAGPDTSITSESIVQQVSTHLKREMKDTVQVIRKMFLALDDLLGKGELRHLKTQLPRSMRDFVACREVKKGEMPGQGPAVKPRDSGVSGAPT